MGEYIGIIVMVTLLTILFVSLFFTMRSVAKASRKFWDKISIIRKEAEIAGTVKEVVAVAIKLDDMIDEAFGVHHRIEIRDIMTILQTKKKIFKEYEQKNSI